MFQKGQVKFYKALYLVFTRAHTYIREVEMRPEYKHASRVIISQVDRSSSQV